MFTFITLINSLSKFLFDIIYKSLAFLGPLGSLVVISFLSGLLMLWIFGQISNQAKIKQVKNRIKANLIAVRLFNNNLSVFMRLQFRILRDTLIYLRYSFVPMLFMMIPVLLIIIQLNLHYGKRAIFLDEQALVKATVTDPSLLAESRTITLRGGEGYTVETPGVRIPSMKEITWRIRGKDTGLFTMAIQVGEHTLEKSLNVNTQSGYVSERRTGKNSWDLLLYPGEPPINISTGIESIEVTYPSLEISFWGWEMDWLIVFILLSTLFGFSMKGIFGVHV